VRVFEQVSVDSVARVESLRDRKPGLIHTVRVLAYCAGAFAILVFVSLLSWDW